MDHPEIQTALESASASAIERIETLEQCLRDRDANIATLETQVAAITAERDARLDPAQHAALLEENAGLAAQVTTHAATIADLQAQIATLTGGN